MYSKTLKECLTQMYKGEIRDYKTEPLPMPTVDAGTELSALEKFCMEAQRIVAEEKAELGDKLIEDFEINGIKEATDARIVMHYALKHFAAQGFSEYGITGTGKLLRNPEGKMMTVQIKVFPGYLSAQVTRIDRLYTPDEFQQIQSLKKQKTDGRIH